MDFGITMFPTDFSIGVVELGRAVEELGFESLFVPEHTHIPTNSVAPGFPKEYSHLLDPFVALSAVAATTSRIKLGTGICLVIERDPIILAKEVASLDHLSGGRVLLGVGGGWNVQEMQDHGTKPTLRWKILRERVLAMKAIWSQDEPQYEGEFVKFGPMMAWPKPAQAGGPPILMGSDGPRALDRVLEYSDAWMPIGGPHTPDGQWRQTRPGGIPIEERAAELQQLGKQHGRGAIPVTVFGAPMDPKVIEAYAKVGVTRSLFWLPPATSDVLMPMLKRCAEIAKRFA